MAHVLSPCTANSRGEQRLAKLLESLDDDKLTLCFSLGFLPGVRELDLLMIHAELGVFIVEIKAVPLHAIETVSPAIWKISGRDNDESPLIQAQAQWDGLRSYWRARMSAHLPPVCTTACLPEITRYDWKRAFPGGSYAQAIAEGMLFAEDLRDATTLQHRLAYAMQNPPIRTGRAPYPPSPRFLTELRNLLTPMPPTRPSFTDRERLARIERQITAQLRGEFPPEGTQFAIFSGLPGTGKTFRLLAIALFHAYANRRVLFTCFNKTLASDTRRLLAFNDKLKLTRYGIDVLDVNQLALRCFETNGLDQPSYSSADEWGRMVVASLREPSESTAISRYDTILIDEAHDMQDWHLDLLHLHANDGATVCLAMGEGQELYRDHTRSRAWLAQFAESQGVKEKKLRRVFWNGKAQYYAALAFHFTWPDRLQKVEAAFEKIFGKRQEPDGPVVERDGPPIRYIPVPAIPGEFDDDGRDQDDLVSDEYALILERELHELLADANAVPVGLLVLVPSEESCHARWARMALKKVTRPRDGVSYIDYTHDHSRRSIAHSSEIRLCTYHSSRGLEGDRVVVFGLEQIEPLTKATHTKPENLGFIALSRGVFRLC